MTFKITDDSAHMDLNLFVVKLFDSIKCAAGTDNTFQLNLNKAEVKYLAKRIKTVEGISIKEFRYADTDSVHIVSKDDTLCMYDHAEELLK